MKYKRSLVSLALTATLSLSLTACGGSPSAAPTSPNVDSIAPSTPSPSPSPTAKKSPRGNLIKELKAPARIGDTTTKENWVTFTVNSITPDAPCTPQYPAPLENGHLVVLDVTIETTPELLAEDDTRSSNFDMNAAMFKFVGANGTTFNGDLGTMGADACLPDEARISSKGVGPAEKVTGKIALDVPATTGTLIFKSYLTAGSSGWEWTF